MRSGPGGLKVETTGDAVEVDALTGEVQSRDVSALHGFEVDGFAADSATGHELVFVGSLAHGLVSRLFEQFDERHGLELGQLAPGLFGLDCAA